MKSTLQEKKEYTEIKYPFLGLADDGTIVLFNGEKKGMVLYTDQGPNHIGEYSENWFMRAFIPYTMKITLEND